MPNNDTLFARMQAASKNYEAKQKQRDAEEEKKRKEEEKKRQAEREERARTEALFSSIKRTNDLTGRMLEQTKQEFNSKLPVMPDKSKTAVTPAAPSLIASKDVNVVVEQSQGEANPEMKAFADNAIASYKAQDKRVAELDDDKSWWEKSFDIIDKGMSLFSPAHLAQSVVADWINGKRNTPTTTWQERVTQSTSDAISKLPQDKDGRYIFNGMSYTHDQLMPFVEDYVQQVLHPYMIASDTGYQDSYAQSLGYKDRNAMFEAYKKPLEEMRAELKAEEAAANAATTRYYSENPAYDGGDALMANIMSNKMNAQTNGIQAVDNTLDMINAMQEGNFLQKFGRGLKEGFNLADFATFGIAGLVSDIKLLDVYNKIKDGKELTPTEERIFKISQMVDDLSQYKEANMTTWQSIGEGVGTTATMAPQFMPVMGVAGKIGAVGKLGVKGAVNVTKQAAVKGVKRAILTGVKEAGKVLGRGAWMGIKTTGAGYIVAPAQASTWHNYVQNRQDQFKFVDSQLIYEPTKVWVDLYDALTESATEISSELVGAKIGDLMGLTFKGFGRILGIDDITDNVLRKKGLELTAEQMSKVKKSKGVRAFEKSVGYAGDFVSESLSEVYGDVLGNLMKMAVTGNGDLSKLSDLNYWATTLGVSVLYGGSLQLVGKAMKIPQYKIIEAEGKFKKQCLEKIDHAELKDALLQLDTDTDLNAASQRLANRKIWKGASPSEIAAAMDYIRATAVQQVAMGVTEENRHLATFGAEAKAMSGLVYRGVDGNQQGDVIYTGILEDGSSVPIVAGDVKDMDGILMVRDALGKEMPLARSKVTDITQYGLDQVVCSRYIERFGVDNLANKVSQIESVRQGMSSPDPKWMETQMAELGIAVPEKNGIVMLVDGREGLFKGWTSELNLRIETVTPEGTIEELWVPFWEVLSSASHVAEAQKKWLANKTLNAAKEQIDAENAAEATETAPQTAPVAEAMPSETAPQAMPTGPTKHSVGEIIDTPQGKARVVAVEGGKYVVDYALNAANDASLQELDEYDIEEIDGGVQTPSAEATTLETSASDEVIPTEETASEEAAVNEVGGITALPLNEDGTTNYDAIEDPATFAKAYVEEVGSVEDAIADVTETRAAVEADMQKKIEAGKKMTSMNEKNANRKERQALAERVAFYDGVLAELNKMTTAPVAPVTEVAEPTAVTEEIVEPTPMTEETTPVEEAIEETPTSEVVEEATPIEVSSEEAVVDEPVAAEATPEASTAPTFKVGDDVKMEGSAQVGKVVDITNELSGGPHAYVKWADGNIGWVPMAKLSPHVAEAKKPEGGVIDNEHARKLTKEIYDEFDTFAKKMGVTVEFMPVVIDNGRRVNAKISNGRLVVATRLRSKKASLKWLLGHEFLHRMKTLAPEQYEKFVQSVKDYLGEAEWNKRMNAQRKLYAVDNGMIKESKDDALMTEECVADFLGEMVEENGAFDKYLDTIKEDRPILNAIKRVLKYIADLFNGENRRINEMLKQVDALIMEAEKAWANAPAVDAVSTNKNGKVTSVTNEKTGSGRFSLMTYEEGGRDALASFLASRIADNALTEAEAQQMMSDMERVYEICNEFKDKYAPFGAWSEAKVEVDKNGNPVFSVIKSNGDYAMNLDFSLVCKKRRTLDAVLNEMIKRGMINTLPDDPKEIAKINDVIRKYGFETACRLCFVDAKRFRVLEVANNFANMYNDMVDMLIPKGKKMPVNMFSYAVATEDVEGGLETMADDALNLKALEKIGNKMKKNKKGEMVLDASVPARIARHLLANPQDRRHVQASDFVSTLGFDNVKAQNPELLKLYNAKKGSGGPKASFSDVQYLNDILTQNWSPEAAYAVGGVRLQSFSDYVPRMVFDYIQMVADLAAKGLPVHAYTKEELFAKTFGLTGIKINLSLVPKVVEGGVAAGLDAEGNYAWQEGETFPYDVAVEIQNAEGYRENCGTIAVGVSDEQILKMLDDPNIRMIIPYHKSVLAKKVAIHNIIAAFKDYTNVQNTRKGGKKVEGEKALKGMPNFNEEVRKTNDPRAAATAYLDWCKSKGYTPKFDKFASHPNYYKLLEDFTTLVDETYMPQEAVKFIFPTEESAFGSLETLIEQGLEEDAILEGQRDAKVGAIVDELQEKRYSLIVVNDLKNALKEFDANGDIVAFAEAVSKVNKEYGYHDYLTNVVMNYEEDGDADWFVSRIRNVVGEANEDYAPYTAGGVRYSIPETDPIILDALNNGETMKVYRAMQVIDGELYPPMSAKVDGKLRNPIKIGVWERAEERPDLADEKGNFKLDKGNKTSLKARYNPYIHTSLTPLNDQFSSAQDRPNLVTVEVEVPVSELTSGYKAEKAKDSVGKLEWKAGVVQGQLTGTRTVILSRWDRPIRIVPDSEVAQRIVEMFGKAKVVMPSNVVTPSLRAELEKLGVPFKETTNQGKPRFSVMEIPAYQASAELSVYLEAYKRGQITFNSLVNKVNDVVGKYPKMGLLENAIYEYNNSDKDEEAITAFIHRLEGFISIYPPIEDQDYSKEKETIEETFGGIWIDDAEEFAKFAKAVNNTPFEENGEGIAYTDNYFYAYYRNINGEPVPYASVYMNEAASQDVVNAILKKIKDEGDRDIRGWFDRIDEGVRNVESENDVISGTDKESSNTSANGKMGAKLSRKGRYFDTPSLYVKTSRTDGRRTLKPLYSLISPEMDAAYLSAVERGDMATAQQMVLEAAKLAMPNTKVVDENGNPKVVYHQTNHSAYINRETGQNWDELDWRERMEWDERDDWDDYWEEREFNTFSRVNARTTNELDGFFFAPEYDEYHEYGDRTIEAFLNIENPASNGDYNIDASKTNAGRDERIRMQNEGYDGVINREDGEIYEYIAFNPNQIKSADPVTYDDNGNVIPLSERFNPKKEDIRYSLSERPTGLLTDFAEEFEALQKMYESIDPTTIHAQHPFRIQKRKVVQKYVDYVSKVLGNNVVNIVYDKTNNAHVKKVYDRIVATSDSFKDDISYLEFKELMQSQPVGGTFIKGTNIILFNISTDNLNNNQAAILNSYVHENVHRIVEKLGIDNNILEDILEEGLRLSPNTTNAYIDGYQSRPKFEQGEETLAYSIGNRMSNPQIGMRLLRVIEGYITFEELNATQKILLPLRDSYIEKILNELQNEYKAKREGTDSNTDSANRDGVNGEGKGKDEQVYDRPWRGYSETNGYTRGGVLDDTRYSLMDMPFFEDGGDVVVFDAKTPEEQKKTRLEEAKSMMDANEDAQTIFDNTGWVYTEDGWEYFGEADIALDEDRKDKLRAKRWLQAKRAVAKNRVRNMYRNLVNDIIAEERTANPDAFARVDEKNRRRKKNAPKLPYPLSKEAKAKIDSLNKERDNTLAEIDKEYRDIFERFEADPKPYIQDYYSSEAMMSDLDMFNGTVRKLKASLDRAVQKIAKSDADRKTKMEATKAIKVHVNEILRGELSRYTQKRDILVLMNAVNEARTVYQMLRAFNRAVETMYNIRLRKEMARMNSLTKMRLILNESGASINPQMFIKRMVADGVLTTAMAQNILNNYWRGVNSTGINVAKGVDADTAEVMAFIHKHADILNIAGKSVAEKCQELKDRVDESDESEEMKALKMQAIDIIEDYLIAQEMMQSLKDIKSEKDIEGEIAKLSTEIAKLNNELMSFEAQKEALVETDNGYKSRKRAIEQTLKRLYYKYEQATKVREQLDKTYYGAMPDILARISEANKSVEGLLKEGRIALSKRKQAEVEHRYELVRMAADDINRPEALYRDEPQYGLKEKASSSWVGKLVTKAYGSIEHMLRRAATNAPNGEGKLWHYFTKRLNNAYNNMIDAQKECADIVNAKTEELFGKKFNSVMRKAENTVIGKYVVPNAELSKDKSLSRNKRVVPVQEEVDLTVAQALYFISMWDQANGMETLMRQGFTAEKIQEIKAALNQNNPNWLKFQKWVVGTFLPSRRPKYNETHRLLFGANMDEVVNYFPIRRNMGDVQQNTDLSSPDFENMPSTSTGSIIKRTNSKSKIDLNTSFFGVLQEHIVEMEKWAEMAPVTKDFNLLLSSKMVQNLMRAKGKNFLEEFKNAAKVATLNYADHAREMEAIMAPLLSRMWGAGLIGFKPFTALKQAASSVLFLTHSTDPRFIGRLAYYYAGGLLPLPDNIFGRIGTGEMQMLPQDSWRGNIKWALKNSAMFRERWESFAAGNEVFAKELLYSRDTPKLKKFISEAISKLSKGSMAMIALIDAYTSAAGMRAIYDNVYNAYIKDGATPEQAHEEALFRAELAVNKTQQSAQFMYLSPMQVSSGIINTSLSAFQNAPIAQGRLFAESVAELVRNPREELRWLTKEHAEKLKEGVFAKEYAGIEALLEEEKAQGLISTEEEETQRREELQRVLNINVKTIAERKAKKALVKNKFRAGMNFFITGYLATLIFNLMGQLPYLLWGDDDEKKEEMLKDTLLWSMAGPLSSIPVFAQLVNVAQGYDFEIFGAYADLKEDVDNLAKHFRESGVDTDFALMALDFAARKGMGIDYKTIYSIYSGIEDMARNGYSKEALFRAMAAPNSQVKLLVGQRKEGETQKEFYTRIMRMYDILEEEEYGKYFDEEGDPISDEAPQGMSKSYYKNLPKQWETEYRKSVVANKESYAKYYELEAEEKEYKDAVESMGWTANKKPNKKAFETSKYVAPIEGLAKSDYLKLKKLGNKVALKFKNTSTYKGGDDDKYYDMLMEEMKAKREFLEEYKKVVK